MKGKDADLGGQRQALGGTGPRGGREQDGQEGNGHPQTHPTGELPSRRPSLLSATWRRAGSGGSSGANKAFPGETPIVRETVTPHAGQQAAEPWAGGGSGCRERTGLLMPWSSSQRASVLPARRVLMLWWGGGQVTEVSRLRCYVRSAYELAKL